MHEINSKGKNVDELEKKNEEASLGRSQDEYRGLWLGRRRRKPNQICDHTLQLLSHANLREIALKNM